MKFYTLDVLKCLIGKSKKQQLLVGGRILGGLSFIYLQTSTPFQKHTHTHTHDYFAHTHDTHTRARCCWLARLSVCPHHTLLLSQITLLQVGWCSSCRTPSNTSTSLLHYTTVIVILWTRDTCTASNDLPGGCCCCG